MNYFNLSLFDREFDREYDRKRAPLNARNQLFYVYDMFTKKCISTSSSLDGAMIIIQNDLRKSPGRCYEVYNGLLNENKNPVWFGDARKLNQYSEVKPIFR